MRLLVKSDDYGFTKGITEGILDGIRNGIIRNTGLFTNCPTSKMAAERLLSEFPDFCLGNEINIVSGRPVSDPKYIPDLVDETGEFVRSTLRIRQAKEEHMDFWPYDQCYIEVKAQVGRFIELTGQKPKYLAGHSITLVSPNFYKALETVGEEYGIPFSQILEKEFHITRLAPWTTKPFTLEAQYDTDTESHVLKELERLKDKELVMISGHCGFVDAELLKYSSYTLIRAKDHQMYTSEKIKQWIRDNHVELTTFEKEIQRRRYEYFENRESL